MKSRPLILAAIAGTIVVVLAAGGYLALKKLSPTERLLGELRATPLVGLMMAEFPNAEKELRQAIEEEQRQPTTQGPPRPVVVVAELRREHIVPVLRNADDATAIATVAARAELVAHLQKTNQPACREFALGGIRRVDQLDAEGQRLFNNVLKSLEAAFRSGRANADKPQFFPSGPQVGELLREAGFEKSDFDKLNSFATLSNEVSCEIELKVDLVPGKLPAGKRGPFSRVVIAN
jgi:hypothetical protein